MSRVFITKVEDEDVTYALSSCLVCCEACNDGALDYRVTHHSIYTIAKATRDLYWKFRYEVTEA